MSTPIKPGEAPLACPLVVTYPNGTQVDTGRTLWDEFAKAVLGGLAANPERRHMGPIDSAKFAADCAEAMLAERALRNGEKASP